MEERIDTRKHGAAAMRAMYGLEQYLASSKIEKNLLHLIKFRVSQINGCGYCLDMHSKDLRKAGETEQRLYVLDAWREAPFYSDRERAALAYAEAVTLITEGHVPDDVFEQAKAQFSDDEMVDLTTAIVTINGWNRFSIAFRTTPGTYQPA